MIMIRKNIKCSFIRFPFQIVSTMSCCSDYDDDLCYRERLQYPAHCATCSCRKSELEVTHKITQYSTPSYRKTPCHCLPELICSCPCDNNLLDCDLCLCYECRKVRGRSQASIHRKEQRILDTHHSPCYEHRCTHVTQATQVRRKILNCCANRLTDSFQISQRLYHRQVC